MLSILPMNSVLQFEEDIDAIFAIAYSELKTSKRLFKRRLLAFKKEYGVILNDILNTANRMALCTFETDHDDQALHKARNFCHMITLGWIIKRQNLFNKIENELF